MADTIIKPAKHTPDFLQVRLSAAGQHLAGGNPLSVANGRSHFRFSDDVAQKVVLGYEWRAWLSKSVTPTGDAMFELVPDPAAAAASAAGPGTASAPHEADTDHAAS